MLLADLQSLSVSFTQVLYVAIVVLAVVLVATAVVVLTTNRKLQRGPARHWISRLLYGIYLMAILVLAVTGLGSILRWEHMSGYALMVHVAVGGGFVFLMVAIAVLYLPAAPVAAAAPAAGSPAAVSGAGKQSQQWDRWWLIRWSAWGLVLSSLVAAGTMLLSMLPVLDTTGLLQMAMLHRYAGLAVVMAAAVHWLALTCVRLGWR